jgi:hypothetical protein
MGESRQALAFRLYREEHLTPAQVAVRMGIAMSSAHYYRKLSGLAPRPTRQQQVVAMLAEGKPLDEIAGALGITRKCVRAHRNNAGLPTRTTEPDDYPKCRCGLRLFTEAERQQGHCNGCLPTSAVAFLGRNGESRGSLVLPRPY